MGNHDSLESRGSESDILQSSKSRGVIIDILQSWRLVTIEKSYYVYYGDKYKSLEN